MTKFYLSGNDREYFVLRDSFEKVKKSKVACEKGKAISDLFTDTYGIYQTISHDDMIRLTIEDMETGEVVQGDPDYVNPAYKNCKG